MDTDHYWVVNASIPVSLLRDVPPGAEQLANAEHLLRLHVEIQAGAIVTLTPTLPTDGRPQLDLRGGQLWPCFIDLHTHLDKGHIWPRASNPDGTFAQAVTACQIDAQTHWQAEDLYRRMTFGLECSYAHGTQAIRTHLDSWGEQAAISWAVFRQLRDEWADRITLQAASLVTLDHYAGTPGEALADWVATAGGILGGVVYPHPDWVAQIERVLALARDRGVDVDFHVDETGDAAVSALSLIAEAALRHQFPGQIVCGHCCSLAMQPSAQVQATIAQVQAAGIGIVSLPQCNLYLQGRLPGQTPRWRGVTLVHELAQAGVPVALASDNCRDPFHAFGDHDVLEVFAQAVKIAHLDHPFAAWCPSVTAIPARLMGLANRGTIGVGVPADLIGFRGRGFTELLARSQHDRQVIRAGKLIAAPLPDYALLDDLMAGFPHPPAPDPAMDKGA
ncbi:cytosine deaminase [Trichothermofontia sp.]